MSPEARIVSAVVRVAEADGWWCMKVHGGPMQKAGIPDLLLLKDGRALFFEAKQPGLGKKSEATPLQRRRMDEILAIGGVMSYVVHSAAEAAALLRVANCKTPASELPRRETATARQYGCERRSKLS